MKKIYKLFLCSFLFLISFAYATTGLLFNVSESGSPASVDIILCLNGKGPVSCQKYHVSAQNLSISTTVNHTYPIAGIKVLTIGYSPSGCTPYPNGYCLFQTSSTGAASLVLTPNGQNGAPGAPTNVVAAVGNASSLVTWTAPASAGSSPILLYTVTASNGNTCTATPPQTQCRVTGLTNGSSYTFTVTATNAEGTGAASAPSNAVTPALYKVLGNFTTTTGFYAPSLVFPWGALVQGTDGDLYGVAPNGGQNNAGTVFKYSFADGTLTAVANFDSTTTGPGSTPYGRLLAYSDGNFYGTATLGGVSGVGTIYKFSPTDGTLTPLASFNALTNGVAPVAGLIQASDGDFYGTTYTGGLPSTFFGIVYKFSLTGNVITKIAGMNPSTTGQNLVGELLQASDGNLYGTAVGGGSSSDGTVFSVSILSNTITPLASFSNATGVNPVTSLIQAMDGSLYGTTLTGAADSSGGVFRILPGGSSIELVNSFNSSTNGSHSLSTLVQVPDGSLYGTTALLGPNNGGTIFKVDPVGGAITTVLDLNASTTGAQPYGGLLLASDGNLYGMTAEGGSDSHGTLFVIYAPL